MKTYKYSLFLLILILPNAYAASSYSGDSLSKIYLEMRYLYRLGVDLHQRYDFSDRQQIRACNVEAAHNGTRARNLIGAVNRIEYPDKQTLIDAAWSTYACSSCKGDGAACDDVPPQLEKIRQLLEPDSTVKTE